MTKIFKLFIFATLLASKSIFAGPGIMSLNSEQRQAIREAEMQKFSNKKNENVKQSDSVTIVNNTDSLGLKKKECITKVGNVIRADKTKGTSQQSVTYIDGSVINICE